MGILRKIFGPSKDEVWEQFSCEVGGRIEKGGFSNWYSRVDVRHGEWTITMDNFKFNKKIHTRIRAPYLTRDNFRFKIHRKMFFSGIGKVLGMQDVEVGYEEFDKDFIIKGNNEVQVIKLFANDKIRELFSGQRNIFFRSIDDEGLFGLDYPEGVDELYINVRGVIRDIDRLRQLFDLFAEVLDELCRIGSAYEDDPRVELK